MATTDPTGTTGYAYQRAADTIAGRIDAGLIAERLPAERALARELGVSYQTLRHAIGILRDRGLIVTRHGLGSFVAPEDGGTGMKVPALVPASYRNPDSPADRALAAIVDRLGAGGYGFAIPAWDGHAYLRVSSGRRAIADLTITSSGDVTWEYRFAQCPYLDLERLTGITIDLLAPDGARLVSGSYPNDGTPLQEAARYALLRHGFTAAFTDAGADIGHVLAVANPDRSYRGTVRISGHGGLQWNTRVPHHRDGGLPLPDIAAAISRTLTRLGPAPWMSAIRRL